MFKIKSPFSLDIKKKALDTQIRDHKGSKVFYAQLLTDEYFVYVKEAKLFIYPYMIKVVSYVTCT